MRTIYRKRFLLEQNARSLGRHHRLRALSRLGGLVVVGLALALIRIDAAFAYIGPSYLKVPGIRGEAREHYRGWIQFEANYWSTSKFSFHVHEGQDAAFYSGPAAPRSGAGELNLALSKHSIAYAPLMAKCASNGSIPELTYDESSERARAPSEFGHRPADIPEFYEYTLSNVTITCPVADGAPEQAFVLQFQNIAWRNYQGGDQHLVAAPASLPPAKMSGHTLAYVVTWFNSANSVNPNQCAAQTAPPNDEEKYRFLTPDQAAAARTAAQSAGRGRINNRGGLRGPGQLNVGYLPGIIRDPGQPTPNIGPDRGFDLKGDGHIHNNLFQVEACFHNIGPKGILTVTKTEARRNGEISMLVLISGIDDERNDNHVDVTLAYSPDPMVKSADGQQTLPGYTFRISGEPQRVPYFERLHGRIVNGVVLTDPAKMIEIDKSHEITRLFNARMRLQLNPDRTMTGLVGGYEDWRTYMNFYSAWYVLEDGLLFNTAAMYNTVRRNADGMRDPATGQYTGISAAYDMNGVQAFIPPDQEQALLRGGTDYATIASVDAEKDATNATPGRGAASGGQAAANASANSAASK